MVRMNIGSWIQAIEELMRRDEGSRFSGWILIAIFVGVVVYNVIKWINKSHDYFKGQVPQQLVQLVLQAHQNGPIETMWDIKVSERMRDALCAPLTPEQLATIRAAEEGVFSRRVSCRLLSSRWKGRELSGLVQVSVMVHSKYSKTNMFCPETKLRITVSGAGNPGIEHRWVVTSVEQIA